MRSFILLFLLVNIIWIESSPIFIIPPELLEDGADASSEQLTDDFTTKTTLTVSTSIDLTTSTLTTTTSSTKASATTETSPIVSASHNNDNISVGFKYAGISITISVSIGVIFGVITRVMNKHADITVDNILGHVSNTETISASIPSNNVQATVLRSKRPRAKSRIPINTYNFLRSSAFISQKDSGEDCSELYSFPCSSNPNSYRTESNKNEGDLKCEICGFFFKKGGAMCNHIKSHSSKKTIV